jgi:hypothetical protein
MFCKPSIPAAAYTNYTIERITMIAIHTKYISASNSRGSRIKAYTASSMGMKGFQATISYPSELSGVDCHFEAVKALVAKHELNWKLNDMRYGDSADGRGYSFCFDASKVEAAL